MSPVATQPNVHAEGNGLAQGSLKQATDVAQANSNGAASQSSRTPPDLLSGLRDLIAPPKFSSQLEEREYIKFRLAQAFRIFGNLGYDEGAAGHITVRDNIRPDCFWVNPFGKHFSLIQPGDLILVDHEGVIQDESGPIRRLNRAAYMIHSAIHEARPDVNCAAHSHSIYGRAFSTLGKDLDMITQDSCTFYNDIAVYRQFGGIVLEAEEGEHIVKALGDKKAVILQNHGLLVAAGSVEATLFFYIALEKCCQVQLLADAAADGTGDKTIKISLEEALYTYKVLGSEFAGKVNATTYYQVLEAREGVDWESYKAKAL
ncbi:arad-like aldolase/epimerase [Obba rivulosa]|uniref:Arad-like aldolase/epimerase n=1 Tax=Obba rivulosa TaxID=1052685 RepID=A0A8E2DGY6_9APHY|nr:arad-like aldolase/epimerase [Obba rivulosa]